MIADTLSMIKSLSRITLLILDVVQLQWFNEKLQNDLASLLGLIYVSLITFETKATKIEELFSKLKIFESCTN